MVVGGAEVIKSSLSSWSAVSSVESSYPVFGSLVVIYASGIDYYGMVSEVVIQSADEVYVPVPLGLTQAEIYRHHPQALMHTQVIVSCVSIGYRAQASVLYQWPPSPPAIHALVEQADDAVYRVLLETHDYIAMIMRMQGLSGYQIEEMILAFLRQCLQRRLMSRATIEPWIASLAPWFTHDYVRFRQLLARAERLISLGGYSIEPLL